MLILLILSSYKDKGKIYHFLNLCHKDIKYFPLYNISHIKYQTRKINKIYKDDNTTDKQDNI